MEHSSGFSLTRGASGWLPASQEPEHPLAALDGRELAGGRLQVLLGPTSRFGARYFAALLATSAHGRSTEPVITGLQHSGPLPSYNWIEVAETKEHLRLEDGSGVEADADSLFALLLAILPPGGHLMVEYDSPQRTETARALALGVPPIATPLGHSLFRIGFAAHFKDWQIAEGGSEGPRKLQAYKPPSDEDATRWKREAARDLTAFLQAPSSAHDAVQAARRRAEALLLQLQAAQ